MRELPRDACFLAARVRVTLACPECASPVPVNGIVDEVLCGACQAVVELRGELGWDHILQYQSGEGCMECKVMMKSSPMLAMDYFLSMGPRGGVLFRRWRNILLEVDAAPVACHECRGPLDAAKLAQEAVSEGSGVDAFCPSCGEAVPIRIPGRDERGQTHDQCLAIVGETALRGDLSEPESEVSVLFSCLGCGAPAKVDATVPRLLRCEYCEATSYLPDALWLRLHPAQRKRPWYLLLLSTPSIHAGAQAKI